MNVRISFFLFLSFMCEFLFYWIDDVNQQDDHKKKRFERRPRFSLSLVTEADLIFGKHDLSELLN